MSAAVDRYLDAVDRHVMPWKKTKHLKKIVMWGKFEFPVCCPHPAHVHAAGRHVASLVAQLVADVAAVAGVCVTCWAAAALYSTWAAEAFCPFGLSQQRIIKRRYVFGISLIETRDKEPQTAAACLLQASVQPVSTSHTFWNKNLETKQHNTLSHYSPKTMS